MLPTELQATDGRDAHVLDARGWTVIRTLPLPPVRQGESLAFHPDGTGFLIGSEGEQSPLLWVDFDQATRMARSQEPAALHTSR